jgi:hypothetical protein
MNEDRWLARLKVPDLPTPADICAAQREQLLADLRAQVAALLLPTILLASDVNENRARKAGARQALEIIDAVIDGSGDD